MPGGTDDEAVVGTDGVGACGSKGEEGSEYLEEAENYEGIRYGHDTQRG